MRRICCFLLCLGMATLCFSTIDPRQASCAQRGFFPEEPAPAKPAPAKPFDWRQDPERSKLLSSGGGSTESGTHLVRGMNWLALQQKVDGSWHFDGKDKDDTIGATGFALLPFMAAGHTPKCGKYQKNIDLGLKYLLSKLPLNSGRFDGRHAMSRHAIATIALCEAYGMSRDKTLLGPAQSAIDYIVKAQGPDGGWRDELGEAGDTSVLGWQSQALYAARLTKDIVVDNKALKRASEFLDKVSGGGANKPYYSYEPAGRQSAATR